MSLANWKVLGEQADSSAKKLLICPCPGCYKPLSSRSLQEHIANSHLPTKCLQIARCMNKKCTREKDIFSVSYLTHHICEDKAEHRLIVPKKACKHRVECQKVFDSLFEISIWLGFVNPKKESMHGREGQARIDKFISAGHKIDQLVKMELQKDNIPLKSRPACFVTETYDEIKRNGGTDSYETREMTNNYDQRSPAYDYRSPGRSPGSSPANLSQSWRSPGPGGRSPGPGGRSPGPGGRSPGPGGRSPGPGGRSPGPGGRSPAPGGRSPGPGGRSPGPGGRSPGPGGRSPGYNHEPAYRFASYTTSQESFSRPSSHEHDSSRPSRATKRQVKTEIAEQERRIPDAHPYVRPPENRATSANATSSIPVPRVITPPAPKRMAMSHDFSHIGNSSIYPAMPYLNSAYSTDSIRGNGHDNPNASGSSRSSIHGSTASLAPPMPKYSSSPWSGPFPQDSGYLRSQNYANTYSSSYNPARPLGPRITPQLDKMFPTDDNDKQNKGRDDSERRNNGYYGGRR